MFDNWNLVGDFFKGVKRPEFVVGWAGQPAMRQTETRSVPATFVLDEHRRVVYFSGLQLRGHEEIGAAIEGLLIDENEAGQ